MHIVGDEAYSPLAAECNNQILSPFSQHQLNSASQLDSNNLKELEARMQLPNAPCSSSKPVPIYWKMRGFNHELSSEHIKVKRCLGMMVRCFGILWTAMEFSLEKAPTIFHVICKLHNVCMDRWLRLNPHYLAWEMHKRREYLHSYPWVTKNYCVFLAIFHLHWSDGHSADDSFLLSPLY